MGDPCPVFFFFFLSCLGLSNVYMIIVYVSVQTGTETDPGGDLNYIRRARGKSQ